MKQPEIIFLFRLFMLGMNRESGNPQLPYTGGLMEQPYYETQVWEIFQDAFIDYKIETMPKIGAK